MKYVCRLIVFILFVLCPSWSVSGQEWIGVNRDDYGNVVRGAYLTNEWFDNWYIGMSGGVQTAMSKINDPRVSPQFDFTLLKWFTPSIGARVGYQGFSGKEYLYWYNPWQINHAPLPYDGVLGDAGTLHYGLGYVHGDLLWNISNSWWGYKYQRFYECSPYVHAGFTRLYDNSPGEGISSVYHDNEFAFGSGVLNTFRLTDRLCATVDLRHYSIASRYKTSDGVRTHHLVATAGLSYNIYKTYWNRAQGILKENQETKEEVKLSQQMLQNANAEIACQQQELAVAGEKLADTTKQLQDLDQSMNTLMVTYDFLRSRVANADIVVYFYINQDTLNFSELHHLDAYVQEKLRQDPKHIFYLTGSADIGTGSFERNTYLCRSRAYRVRDILVKDYGVNPKNVVIKSTLVTDKHLDGALDRCVIIENE